MAARRREYGAGSKQARPFQGTVSKMPAKLHDPAVLVPQIPNGSDSILQKGTPHIGVEAHPVEDQLWHLQDARLFIGFISLRSQMHMHIDKARHQGVAGQVENFCSRWDVDFALFSDLNYRAIFNEDLSPIDRF